jgi:hypothetical protein
MTPHRSVRFAWAVALSVWLVAICGCADHPPPGDSGPPPSIPDNPAADQSAFFAGSIDTYGQQLTPREIDERAVARAVRRIDPCGFIDPTTAAKQIPGAAQYRYVGLAGCTVLQDPTANRPASDVTIHLNYTAETAGASGESAPTSMFMASCWQTTPARSSPTSPDSPSTRPVPPTSSGAC